jgi:hypothetical protein
LSIEQNGYDKELSFTAPAKQGIGVSLQTINCVCYQHGFQVLTEALTSESILISLLLLLLDLLLLNLQLTWLVAVHNCM